MSKSYGLMSKHQDKTWSFDSREERDIEAEKLQQNGFEARHGVYKLDPIDELDSNPYKGIIAKHGNCWY